MSQLGTVHNFLSFIFVSFEFRVGLVVVVEWWFSHSVIFYLRFAQTIVSDFGASCREQREQ